MKNFIICPFTCFTIRTNQTCTWGFFLKKSHYKYKVAMLTQSTLMSVRDPYQCDSHNIFIYDPYGVWISARQTLEHVRLE